MRLTCFYCVTTAIFLCCHNSHQKSWNRIFFLGITCPAPVGSTLRREDEWARGRNWGLIGKGDGGVGWSMNFGSPWERNVVRRVENKGVNLSLLLNAVGLVQSRGTWSSCC